jgi:hypothetical protein
MYIKGTFIGGLFTLFFFLAAGLIIADTLILYANSNIQESKSLLPLVVLENSISAFASKEISISTQFLRYGDACSSLADGSCGSEISLKAVNFVSLSSRTTCRHMAENQTCQVLYECFNCTIHNDAYIQISLKEPLSYASGINVRVISDSSIPGYISRFSTELSPTPNYIFIGPTPTTFYFAAIPSLFESQSSLWSNATGYHISSESVPKLGSQYFTDDLSMVSDLNVIINIDQSSTGLYTLRTQKQTLLIVISTLLGSIFGVMGAVGGGMSFVEKNAMRMKHKIQKRIKFQDLQESRNAIGMSIYEDKIENNGETSDRNRLKETYLCAEY